MANINSQKAFFAGGYVREMVSTIIAALASGENINLLGAPGYGKTDISFSLAHQLTGNGSVSFTEVEPSTPAEVVRGIFNPARMLEGVMERVVDGTPYDPNTKIAIIDEIGRGNEALFDALLHVLKQVKNPNAPAVIATSNFMPESERTAALIDRFALWFWVTPDTIDIQDIAVAHLTHGNGRPEVDMTGLPTWDDITAARNAVAGPNALRAVTQVARELQQEAEKVLKIKIHPRRQTQWVKILFHCGVLYSGGNADFTSVPDEAVKVLRYAMPALSPEEQATWREVANTVVDAVGAAIEAAMTQVVRKMNEVAQAEQSRRAVMIPGLAQLMQSTQSTLVQVTGDASDKRVTEAVTKMNEWLSKVVRGEAVTQ